MCAPLTTLCTCPRGFFTTTRRSRWPAFWGGEREDAGLLRAAEPLPVRRINFGAAKGNDKGKSKAWSVTPGATSWFPFRASAGMKRMRHPLEAECRKRRQRRWRGHSETIGAERFERDRAAMLPLPVSPYEACEKISARVNSLSLVRYRAERLLLCSMGILP